jgi:hypothetical protein
MEIDPTNYKIAVSQAEASVQSAQANVQNIDAQMDVQQAQISTSPRLQRRPQEKRSGLLQYPGSHWNRGRLASRARGCGFWLLFVCPWQLPLSDMVSRQKLRLRLVDRTREKKRLQTARNRLLV